LAETGVLDGYKSARTERRVPPWRKAAGKSFSLTSPLTCVTPLHEPERFHLLKVHPPPPAIPPPSGTTPTSLRAPDLVSVACPAPAPAARSTRGCAPCARAAA